MAGMHLHLNSEDQALLKAVELAVAAKGEGAVAGDASVEGLAYKLAGSAPVASDDFQAGLLARLQAAMESGDVGAYVDTDVVMQDIRGEIVENNVATVPSVAWDKNDGIERSRVRNYYRETGRATNDYRRFWGGFAAVAALIVFSIGLVALLGSRASYILVPSAVNIATPTGVLGIAAAPTATTAAMAEPSATASDAFLGIILNVGTPVTVTPVDSAAIVKGLTANAFKIPVSADAWDVQWSMRGDAIATGSSSGVEVWDGYTGRKAFDAGAVGAGAESMAWSPDGSVLALGYADGHVAMISAANGALVSTLRPPTDSVTAAYAPYPTDMYLAKRAPNIAWSPDGKLLASVANMNPQAHGTIDLIATVFVWEVEKGTLKHSLSSNSGQTEKLPIGLGGDIAITKIQWSPDGKRLASLDEGNTISLWNVATGTLENALYDRNVADNPGWLSGFDWSVDGTTIAQPMYKQIDLWDVSDGRGASLNYVPESSMAGFADADAMLAYKWSPNSETLATLDGLYKSSNVNLSFWNGRSQSLEYRYTFTTSGNVQQQPAMAWSPDGQVLAYAVSGVALWSVLSKADLKTLPNEYPVGMWWSPDGSRLAVLGYDGLEIWGDVTPASSSLPPISTPSAKAICGVWAMANAPPVVGNAGLADVEAIGSSDVWAVGYARPTVESEGSVTQFGDSSSLALHWDGAVWTRMPVPAIGDGGNQLNGVAGVTADDVWAVGTSGDFEGLGIGYAGAGNVGAFVVHWDGKEWRQVDLPEVKGAGSARLLAVGAMAKDDVWAVGYTGGDFVRVAATTVGGGPMDEIVPSLPLVLHWDGVKWSVVDAPAPGTVRSQLRSVSVVSKDEVWAVGVKTSQPPRQMGGVVTDPYVLRWDGAIWTKVVTPDFANILDGVSVSADGSGWIAASNGSEGDSIARTARWDGRIWSEVTIPALENDGKSGLAQDSLGDVVNVGKDNAWIVGSTKINGRGNRTDGLIMHWDGWQWGSVPLPAGAGSSDEWPYNLLTGLSVSQSGEAWAVGRRSGNGPTEAPLILRFDRSGCDGTDGQSP